MKSEFTKCHITCEKHIVKVINQHSVCLQSESYSRTCTYMYNIYMEWGHTCSWIYTCSRMHFIVPVQFREYCVYAHAAKPTDKTPRIDECIQLFNGITSWVVCNILREITMVKRADIIEKFIDTTRVSLPSVCVCYCSVS